ncbi:hypothetical protein RZN05_16755 [Sphingomonas sp. HF-S4]|uniref:DUF6916 domain-containing protein n=1 Tax=Sphingomonas agrestis TaxID=3080540 RepID=A0ABU3YB84_9SPHN|nr:hypothetical protein [Sphingomonas sp. HF-S4]MDV3458651.1 hypothetical protein [Sphingomonas sp. HF-S4]
MTPIRLSDFATGTVYDVVAADTTLPLTLASAQALPDSGREGGSFRLEFLGPSEPVLPQAMYRFGSGDVGHEIFIVPTARDTRGIRYEAIFY